MPSFRNKVIFPNRNVVRLTRRLSIFVIGVGSNGTIAERDLFLLNCVNAIKNKNKAKWHQFVPQFSKAMLRNWYSKL